MFSRIVNRLLRSVRVTEYKHVDQQSRKSEERYREMFESAPIALWDEDWSGVKKAIETLRNQGVTDLEEFAERDPDGARRLFSEIKFLDANQAAVDIYGAASKEQLLQVIHDRYQTQALRAITRSLARFANKETISRDQYSTQRIDGSEFPILITITIPEAHHETWKRVIVAIEDISELKKVQTDLQDELRLRRESEQARQESEERFRSVVNHSPTKIHIKDLEGRYVLVNGESEKLFGVSEEEARGKTTHEIFPDRKADDFRAHDQAVLETGQTIEQEEQWELDDGVHTYLTVKFPIRDGDGEIVATGAIGTDITERTRAEEALRVSEERFQSLAEIGSDWMWEMDSDLRFSYFSDPTHKATGLSREHYLGKTRAEVGYDNGDDKAWRQHLADLEAHRPFRNFCYTIVHTDGSTRHWSTSGRPILDANGKFEGYHGIGSDITERKVAEEAVFLAMKEAKIANRAKTEFLANMSHELRTPLNAIIGFSEIIKNETFGPVGSTKYRDYADDINESGQNLLTLINDILDVSKIESGTDELHETDIDIPAIVRSIARLVEGLAQTANVELELEVPDGVPALHADARKVRQILVNLLSNAIKFTPGGGKVALKIWSRAESGYVFQVTDTGIGIAFEDIPRALAPFQQIDSGLNRIHEGTGLGLPLTKSLIEIHGGCLDLQSEVGVGTTVTVRFPAERVVASPHDAKALDAADFEERSTGSF